MTRRIIGVHGLANKPDKETLSGWWLQSINEGLGHIGSTATLDKSQFEMIYWADLMYVKAQSESEADDSPFKLIEKYAPAATTPKRHDDGILDRLRAAAGDAMDNVLDKVDFLDGIADVVSQLKLKDLAIYWNKIRALDPGKTAKEVLCSHIRDTLSDYESDEVMLIAHSMGSIISLDTLIDNPSLKVAHLVTIGSPLGLPRVKRRIAKDNNSSWPVIPDNIAKWTNFSDHRDPVCGDPFLGDDYRNSRGEKMIIDDIVKNEFEFKDLDGETKSNCHKSYGYLRSPEVSECISQFLLSGDSANRASSPDPESSQAEAVV